MIKNRDSKVIFILLCIIASTWQVDGRIRFGSRESLIKVSSGSTLDLTKSLTVNRGSVQVEDSGTLSGNNLTMNAGTYETSQSSGCLTGDIDPDVSGEIIVLQGSATRPAALRAEAGMIINSLKVSSQFNRLEGFPLFENPIELSDSKTTLTVAIKSSLNKNIELNGGRIILEDDLMLSDGVSLTGPGTIELNGRRFSFGTEDLHVTSSLFWIGAADVYLSGKIDLSATWSFSGDCYFNADSTTINLLPGGGLAILPDSSLRIRQLKIKGLGGPGDGQIYFENTDEPSTSVLYMRRAALEITTTYTVNRGHIVVEIGSGQFITRDNSFVFQKPGRLTVDGVNAYYKTRTYPDNNNIRPIDPPYNASGSPIILQKEADIYHFKTLNSIVRQTSSSVVGEIGENKFLGAGSGFWRIDFPNTSGNGWYFHFGRSVDKVLIINAGLTANLTDIVLKDFSPHHLDMEPNSELIFKDKVTIELGENIPDPTKTSGTITWTFQGDNKIDGRGKVVSMDDLHFLIQQIDGGPSTLILQDMIIDNFNNSSITIENDDSKVIFKDVKIILTEDVTYPKGFFEIEGSTEFYSGVTTNEVRFIYNTNAANPSVIRAASRLHFDRNVTFSYTPGTNNNSLINLSTKSSELSLHGAKLYNHTMGLQLTKGALVIDHKCFVENEATTLAEGLIIGDGALGDNDLTIEFLPGGNIDQGTSKIDYKNVNG